MGKCFCHLNGYEVKDAQARREITQFKSELEQFKSNFFYIKDFGAIGDGVTDDTEAFQNAINYLKNLSSFDDYSKHNTLILTGGKYKITNTIELSPFVSIKTDGYVTIESYVENVLFNLSPEENPDSVRVGLNRYNYLFKELIDGKSGFRIINKLESRGNTIAFNLGNNHIDNSKYYTLAKTLFKHININGFNIGIKIIPYDFYAITFDFVYMEQNNYCIVVGDEDITGYKNSGENISFNNCIFAGSQIVVLYNTPEQAIDFNFNECSFDFNNCMFYSPNNDEAKSPARKISIDNSHIEGISYQITDENTPHGILYGTFRGYVFTISNSRILQTNNYNLFYSKSKTSYTLNLTNDLISCYSLTEDFSNPNYPFMGNENVKNINIIGNWSPINTGVDNRLSSYNNCIVRPDFRNIDVNSEYTIGKTPETRIKINDFFIDYINKINSICKVSSETTLENGKSLEFVVDSNNTWDSSSSSGSCTIRFKTDFINGECGDLIGVSGLFKNINTNLLRTKIECYDSNDTILSTIDVTAPIKAGAEWNLVAMSRFVKLVPGTIKFKVSLTIVQNENANVVDGDKFYIGGLFIEKI